MPWACEIYLEHPTCSLFGGTESNKVAGAGWASDRSAMSNRIMPLYFIIINYILIYIYYIIKYIIIIIIKQYWRRHEARIKKKKWIVTNNNNNVIKYIDSRQLTSGLLLLVKKYA